MQIELITVIQVAALAVIAWSLFRDRNARRTTRFANQTAWQRFREVSIDSDDPRFRFSGANCQVIKTEESGVAWTLDDKSFGNYSLAVFARNEMQEVFHFRFSGGNSFVKHVAPNVAAAVLKSSTGPAVDA